MYIRRISFSYWIGCGQLSVWRHSRVYWWGPGRGRHPAPKDLTGLDQHEPQGIKRPGRSPGGGENRLGHGIDRVVLRLGRRCLVQGYKSFLSSVCVVFCDTLDVNFVSTIMNALLWIILVRYIVKIQSNSKYLNSLLIVRGCHGRP